MQHTCISCRTAFEITPDDLTFYDKVSPIFAGKKEQIPPPTHCPDCRSKRRMAFRNERSLHQRACDRCRKPMISVYRKHAPYTVYCTECWYGDGWDPLEYGKDIDLQQSFFEQFDALYHEVPLLSLVNPACENCAYSNYTAHSKNCYLLLASDQSEDCHYGTYVWKSKCCLDCQNIIDCEFCYELTECESCHTSLFSQKLENCSNCLFCFDCKGCQHCFGCVGLRKKTYCWFNQQLNRTSYEEKLQEAAVTTTHIHEWGNQREELRLSHPHKNVNLIHCEESSGDDLSTCKNARHCFDSFGLEDCAFVTNGPGEVKDCYDFTGITMTERSYEGASISRGFRLLFNTCVWEGGQESLYCILTINCQNTFGCMGIRNKQYCILNKQYTKEVYEELVPRLIAHMRATEEWGEFFPITLSPFGYNETLAQEHFPLKKEESPARGYRWTNTADEIPSVEKIIPAQRLPDSIDDIPDDILNWAIQCSVTERPFRIIKQELEFYRKMQLPIPHLHPDERHRRRMALRNPRKLWKRNCQKCGKEMETTYGPERMEIVYCESCYLQTVY